MKLKALIEDGKSTISKCKAKWSAQEGLTIRRGGGISIGTKRHYESEEQRSSEQRSEVARERDDALVGYESQPLACWVHAKSQGKIAKENKRKKKSSSRDRILQEKLSAGAQWGLDSLFGSEVEEAGHPMPPPAQ